MHAYVSSLHLNRIINGCDFNRSEIISLWLDTLEAGSGRRENSSRGRPGHQLEFPALLDATVVRHGMYQNPSWIQRRFVYFIHEGTMRRRLKAKAAPTLFP